MADSSILIGVSGGPDSLCLLDLLVETGYPLKVATFDHLLRPQSGQEVERVRQYCAERQVAFIAGQADVLQYARDHSLSIEEAARVLRYSFLFQQAELSGASAVAVGHTADDQVETVLMHLLRGAGPSGLAGMRFRTLPNPWSDTIPIIRPLLSTWRDEINRYVELHDLPASQDESNLDTRFFRNRLRHELIPQLETFNPNVRLALWKTAQVLSDEQITVGGIVEAAWQACIEQQTPTAVRILSAPFKRHPAAIQRVLLRKAIAGLIPGLRDVDFEAIERARKFIHSPTRNFGLDLIARLKILYEADGVWLALQDADLPNPGWPQLAHDGPLALEIPGQLLLPSHWELQASFQNLDPKIRTEASNNRDPNQAWLDFEKLVLPLQVRTRWPGDRFQPLGLEEQSMKLSDFFINEKLPRRARAHWPLIRSGEEICWVPGYRIGHPFRLTNDSRKAVHLILQPAQPGREQ